MTTFDARAAKLLAPGEYLGLDDYPGLRLQASARVRSWIYRYRSPVDGRMRQVRIGRWPEMSVSAAIVAWEELKRRRDAGEDIAADKRVARAEARAQAAEQAERVKVQAYTVQRLCEDYLDGYIDHNRAMKGRVEVRRMFNTMLNELNHVPAAEVTRAQAFDLIQGYAKRIPVQAAKLRAELGAAWDYAIDGGRLEDSVPNWWRQILRGKVRSKGKAIAGEKIGVVKRVLSEQEVGELIRWLPNFTRLVEDVLTMYLWTCTRGSEICGMSGAEVTVEGDQWWWTIPKARTKNARHENATDHRVPLFGRALAIVQRRKAVYGDGYLFPARNVKPVRPVEQKSIQAAVFTYQPYSETRPGWVRPRLTVTHWAPHDLRRTARTLMAQLGCDDAAAEAVLGHMPSRIVGIYNRYDYDLERQECLEKLNGKLDSISLLRKGDDRS